MKEGYKKTELGWIPVDWEVKKLEEFSISSSYGPRFSAELYDESGNCRIIRGTDVVANGKVDYAGIPYANISNEVLEKHRLVENDFVVITTADCGVSFVFDTSDVFMPSAYMVRIRFNDKISPYFVNKFFDTKIIKRQVEKHIRKGTIANLPGSDLLKFKICIPPILEQKKIAEILLTVDSQIDNTNKLIEKTKELKKGLMQRLLTKGIGHKEFKKTEIGEIPVEWGISMLNEVVEINPKKELLDDMEQVTFIQMEGISSEGRVIKSDIKKYKEVSKGYTAFKDNDVLLAKITPCFENGKKALVKNLKNGIGFGSTEFHVLRCIENKVLPKFIYYYISTHRFRQLAELNMIGSAGQKRVPTIFLNENKLLIPTLEEQEKITDILSNVDFQIEEYENKKLKLQELKKFLMQQLLIGKIRVL